MKSFSSSYLFLIPTLSDSSFLNFLNIKLRVYILHPLRLAANAKTELSIGFIYGDTSLIIVECSVRREEFIISNFHLRLSLIL